jgi:7-keto-8-aminopelargonate synthetase-like enzyme
MSDPEVLQQIGRTRVRWRNRAFSYFGGCDYFRLASHPAVAAALRAGLRNYGLNVAASRLTTGNHAVYEELEGALAGFFGAPAAVLVSSGYAANSIVAQALRGEFTRVILDEKAHSSLRDASRQFDRPVETFRHRDAADLERALAGAGGDDRPILLTDGLFAHNGAVAPLERYLKSLPAHGLILVDDAHGAGVLGGKGRGTPEFAGVSRGRVIQTITLSKAFGVYGGAILGGRALREKIFERSAMFAGSTPLPPPLAAAAARAVELVGSDARFRERLERNIRYVKGILREAGIAVEEAPTPILAIEPATAARAGALRERLISRGVFPSWIRYPGGPEGGYFRFALSSEHRRGQLDELLGAVTGSGGGGKG